MIFQTKILIIELDNSQFLRSIVLNNSLEPQIQIFKDRLGHFDHLETVPFMIKFETLKTLTMELINNAINSAENIHRKDSDKFFEELNRDIDKEINNNDNTNYIHTKNNDNNKAKDIFFSSSSLDFLENTTTLDQTAEKKRVEQFFFDNSQSELAVIRQMKNSHNIKQKETLTPQQNNNKAKGSEKIKHSTSMKIDDPFNPISIIINYNN